jgi:protein TonB
MTLLLIALLHAGIAGAILALGGPQAILKRLPVLEVSFVASPPHPRAVRAPEPLPPPTLRKPDFAPLPLPPIEVALASPVAPAAIDPVAPTREAIAAQASARVVETGPPQSPRFDLAYLRNPTPPYPPLSRRLKEEGRVVLRVRVDVDGNVQAIELAASSGHPRLDHAALSAVRQWRFTPARAGDRAVAGWAVVPVVFQLSGQA